MPSFVYFSPLTGRFNRADGFCGDKIKRNIAPANLTILHPSAPHRHLNPTGVGRLVLEERVRLNSSARRVSAMLKKYRDSLVYRVRDRGT